MLQGDGKGQARSKSPQDVVRELYAGVDLPKLVQRMLVVMHEVTSASNVKVVCLEMSLAVLCIL